MIKDLVEEDEFYDNLFVYSGNKDLTGFISDYWLDKAKKVLEGL